MTTRKNKSEKGQSKKAISMFSKKTIFLDIDITNTDDLFDYAYTQLAKVGYVKPEFKNAIKEREKYFPTGLPGTECAIAVPHTDPEFVNRTFISVIRVKNTIPFVQMATIDEWLDVKIVFVLGFKKGIYQVKILQALMELFVQSGEQAKKFIEAKDVDESLSILKKTEERVIEALSE